MIKVNEFEKLLIEDGKEKMKIDDENWWFIWV